MEKENILTEDQLKSVTDTLKNNKNETDILLEKIEKEHENDDNSNKPLEEGVGQYIGDGIIIGEGEDSNKLEFNHFDNIDSDIDDIINDNLEDTLSKNYNLSDEEVINFVSVITRVRSGEKFNVYEELPESVKQHILKMAMEQNIPVMHINRFLEFTAKMIIDELIHDTELDAISIDLDKALKELVPSPLEMYSESNKEYIEEEFPKVAEKLKDTEPEKADNLLAMRKGFIYAYTFENMYEVLNNPKVQKSIRRCDAIWSRIKNDYYSIASICKFNLYSIDDLLKSLKTLGYTDIQSKRLLTLFVYTYTDGISNFRDEKEYNDIYRNAFANYFECNIKNLAINDALISDFSKLIKENLLSLSNHIDSLIDAKIVELSNNKNKKRK